MEYYAILAMEPEKQKLPETVDREQFTEVMHKLIATPPLPKAAIPRKRAPKKADPAQSRTESTEAFVLNWFVPFLLRIIGFSPTSFA